MTQQKTLQVCDVCGVTSDEKIINRCNKFPEYGNYFCSKHFAQLYRHGSIIDPSSRTTNDRNEYIIHDDYAELILRSQTNEIDAVVKIDIDDVEKCKKYKWAISDRVPNKKQYARGRINGKNVRLHRYIMDYDGDLVVDHINRDTFDCRKQNLRITTPEVNDANKDSAKAYITEGGKWRSYMKRGGENYYLGTYDTYEEAAKQWDKANDEYMEYVLSRASKVET